MPAMPEHTQKEEEKEEEAGSACVAADKLLKMA